MRCPICEKPTETEFRPFCSKRCADIDLAKWFSESYAIASQDPVDQEALAQHLIEQESQKPH